uniref:Uncharacterized protein n=1 Tax=Timema cristinae TaxID=61476 RepID=A0A7R9DB30_TIMCR|nr:unnamed protein product [Timema cristinae]
MPFHILKELPEVEAQLLVKCSPLVRSYTTSLSLYVVGVLRRYQCCLLLSADQTCQVFEGLCKAVKHVTNPGDCSSAERCVLAHLYDLYSTCSLLKSKPHSVEPFANAYPKIRQALYSALQPSSSNHVCNAQFMAEVFSSPRRGGKLETQWTRQLAESPNNRYSFVCNAVVAVCSETDNDRLNDLAILCAELTACCNALSAEWLGVLMALCCSSNHSSHFIDVLAQVDVQDLSIHNSLAVFTSILIARHCFSLEDFVFHIALPSLVKAGNEGRGDANAEAEAGARLTCHLLLRLFKTVECPQPALYSVSKCSVSTSPHPLPSAANLGYSIKLSCDRHLLAAAHNNIRVGPVLAVLKAILVLADATARDNKGVSGSKKIDQPPTSHPLKIPAGTMGQSAGELSISHILGTSDILGGGDDPMLDLGTVDVDANTRSSQSHCSNSNPLETLSQPLFQQSLETLSRPLFQQSLETLSQPLFQQSLETLSQPLFQQSLETLSQPVFQQSLVGCGGAHSGAEGLSDFAHHVLRQICSQEWVLERCLQNPGELCHPDMLLDSMLTPRQAQRLLHMICYPDSTVSDDSLDQRSIIARILENLEQWTVRMSWLDLQLMFKQFPAGSSELNQWLDMVAKAAIDVFQLTPSSAPAEKEERKRPVKPGSIWLVGPLVSKLSSAVRGRVLKVAGQVLESGNWSSKTRDKERPSQRTSSSLLNHQPFLSLVLTCLKGQDDQREGLLTSLHSQLSQFLQLNKDVSVHGRLLSVPAA